MIGQLYWYSYAIIAFAVVANGGMLYLAYRMGKNKREKPEPEQGDPHERPGTWGRQ